MKKEWRKEEKAFYLPKNAPELITIPAFKFFMIEGEGNPNEPFFEEYISVLYALSYAVKMSPKSGNAPTGYEEYTVYPLEGVWDVSEAAKAENKTALDKNQLVFNLMIRQPDFVTDVYAASIIAKTKKKKPHALLDNVKFGTIEEGPCVQMLHIGSYDAEPASFELMETFAARQGIKRTSKIHREIYLSDPGKVSPDQLKTVLRFQVSAM